MIKPLDDLVSRFGTQITLDENFIVKKQGRYFLLSENVKRLTSKGFYYAGTYLGRVKDGKFFPSFGLLNMVAQKKARRMNVGKKAEWLFICGRDVFEQGITKVTGSTKKGDYILVLNSYG